MAAASAVPPVPIKATRKRKAEEELEEPAAVSGIDPAAPQPTKKRRTRAPASGITRPRNSFIIFRKDIAPVIRKEHGQIPFPEICKYASLPKRIHSTLLLLVIFSM